MTHDPSRSPAPLHVGTVGVGAMGEHHARIYRELPSVTLAGVADADRSRAEAVATDHGTRARSLEALLEGCDAVSVAVPTPAHESVVSRCLAAGVHVLVEKPIADTVAAGHRLCERAREAELVLQVGHVERFNPAVRTARELLADLAVVAVDARRLGPPVDRTDPGGVTADLMIHDVDLLRWLLGEPPTVVAGARSADGAYSTATLRFEDTIGTLTASRVTQRKVRRLAVTARECLLLVDFLEQSVTIHRDSSPEYVQRDGETRYRHGSVIERPRVDTGEPLRRELEAFVDAVRRGGPSPVSPRDALAALETVRTIERVAEPTEVAP